MQGRGVAGSTIVTKVEEKRRLVNKERGVNVLKEVGLMPALVGCRTQPGPPGLGVSLSPVSAHLLVGFTLKHVLLCAGSAAA